MSKHVEEAWLEFKKDVVPEDACDNQVEWIRDGFYAGAISFHKMIMQKVTHESSMQEQKEFIKGVQDEFDEYVLDMTRRYLDSH